MQENQSCCVIGDAMIDILLPTQKNIDFNYILQSGEVISSKSNISGGGTANVSIALSKLGMKSSFIGKVGDDCFGKLFIKDLKLNNITENVSIDNIYKTGLAFTILSNKERFFIVDRGANTNLRLEDINFDIIQNSEYLFLSGYSFQDKITYKTIKNIINETPSKTKIVFNPGSPNLAKMYNNKFIKIVKNYADILILNEFEAKELLHGNIFEELLPYLNMIALTKAEKGSIIAEKDKLYKIKASKCNVIDTTGAGDAYAAGIIYGLSKEMNHEEIGQIASKFAGNITNKIGAR